MKATKQLSCTYIAHSRDFFIQVKNILSYNCIRKPNIIQRNIIDCMELSAEIRSHMSLGEPPEFIPCVSFDRILVGTE